MSPRLGERRPWTRARVAHGLAWRLRRWIRPVAPWPRRIVEALRQAWERRRLERARARAAGWAARSRGRRRALAVGAWTFPVYSQGFVYREAQALLDAGLDLRLVHGRHGRARELAPPLARLADAAVRFRPGRRAGAAELARARRLDPRRVAELLERLSDATGLPIETIERHPHVLHAFAFAALAESFRPDYLHSWFFYEGALAVFVASELLGIPRGLTAYADYRLDDYPFKTVALQLERARLVVATSRRIRDELVARAPAVATRVLVKPNSVDLASFGALPPLRREAGAAFRIAAMSRIDPKKGLPVAVDAMARLVRRGHDVVLEILGDAEPPVAANLEEERRLDERIALHRLADRVVRLGRGSERDARALLARAHAFVAPAVETAAGDQDGIPTALLEAMASGRPVVATDAGSIPEAVTDDVEGLLVPQGDAEALAAALERLVAEPALADRLGAAGARRAAAEFDAAAREPELARAVLRLIC